MITDSEISKVSEYVESKLGLHFPENQYNDFKRVILSVLLDLGYEHNFALFLESINSNALSQKQIDLLATCLTIGETYFFREEASLRALKNIILPPLIESRSRRGKDIRIWSAGCCTGEEAYTLAILLCEIMPDIESWNITILGSDINRNFIRKAINGRYNKWSFRETTGDILNRYFKKIGREYEIIPRIKQMVRFSYLNLADHHYPAQSTDTEAMDLILCRNVIMYFSVEQRLKVLNRFTQALVPNGWLITSPVEVSNEAVPNLTRVMIDDAILYRKGPWMEVKKESPLSSFERPASVSKGDDYFKPTLPFENRSDAVVRRVDPDSACQSRNLKSDLANQREPDFEKAKAGATRLQKKAEQLYQKGFYEEALGLFNKLYGLNPKEKKTIYYIARTYANLGHHSDARMWCEKLIALDPMNANYHYLLATILLELNETALAETILQKVLYLDSRHILAHFVIGNYYRSQGKNKIAGKHYQNIEDLLTYLHDDSIIPESDGITTARMKELISMFR
ncbi:MAG: CheR family methyltransferase [Bacteroidota bacterium]|nr:CheR family methyltransferase [Bacteroidota bacterium]